MKNIKSYFTFSVKDIVEIAIFVAFACVLNLPFLKIRVVDNGGSISLAMVPLFLITYRRGPFKGFIACGIVYGFLNCLTDGYGFATFPFDYLLAFGSISVAGFFSKLIFDESCSLEFKHILFLIISTFIAITLRTLFATISGIIFYGLNFYSSLVYQLTYIVPSYAIVLAVLILLIKPLSIYQKTHPIR